VEKEKGENQRALASYEPSAEYRNLRALALALAVGAWLVS
jgi:hypothetical protein